MIVGWKLRFQKIRVGLFGNFICDSAIRMEILLAEHAIMFRLSN